MTTAEPYLDDRFVPFEGAFNFRDFGGLPVGDSRIRRGRVYRAASPQRLTTADVQAVAALGVAHVFDLRTGEEADRGSWAVAPHMTRHLFEVIDVMPTDQASAPADMPELVDNESFAQRYLYRLERGAPTFVAAADALGQHAGDGVIMNCTAGKDRTGLLAAFLLEALGADREVIVADYAASGGHLMRQLEHQRANPLPGDTDYGEINPLLLEAPAQVMQRLLELVEARHGGIVAFFETQGMSARTVPALREQLLT